MSTFEIFLRYLFLAMVIYGLILGKGPTNVTALTDTDKTRMTIAILLLFALMDIYHGIWAKFRSYMCSVYPPQTQ
jgi:hypothetical protein